MERTFRSVISFALILCMLASMVTVPAFAAELTSIIDIDIDDHEKIYFKVETDKDFTQYSVGEQMVFTITLWADDTQICAPYFKYTFTGDDGKTSGGFVDATGGSVVVSTSVDIAGGVRLVVEPANYLKQVISHEKITKFEGGAIAGASQIKTTFAEPLDFDEFWEEQLSLLDECAPNLVSLEQVSSTNSNFDTYVVKVDCIGDPSLVATNATWTAGVLTVPKNAAAGSLKLRLGFLGYGVSSAGRSNNNGYATFSVCAHSIEQLQDTSYYDKNDLGLNSYGFIESQNQKPETSYFRNMILRDVQAVRFLMKYFGSEGGESQYNGIDTGAWKGLWDGKTIYLTGGSQGGFQSVCVAALVPEVSSININVPWFADVAGNTVSTRIQSTFRPTYADGLRYFDTALMAKRVKASNVTITAGTGDTLCPMYAVQAIYNNINTDKASLRFRQGQTHSATQTYPIDFHQNKTAANVPQDGVFVNIRLKDFTVPESTRLEFNAAFAETWYKLTGNKAIMYSDIGAMMSSDEVVSKYSIVVDDFSQPIPQTSNLQDEITDVIKGASNHDAFGIAYVGEPTDLNIAHQAHLIAAADPDTNVHLCGFGDSTDDVKALAEKIAVNFAGSLFNNQSKDGVEYRVVGIDGKNYNTFMTTNDMSNANVFPITVPAYALKSAEIAVNYETPEETGKVHGIIKINGNGIDKEIKVFNAEDVPAFGMDAGAEWIIQNGVLNIYSNSDISDSEYDWNASMDGVTEIIINEGIRSLGEGALNVPSSAKVILPFSLETIDKNAFCGKNDFTLAAYEATVGEMFASDNGITLESLGKVNTCGTDVYFRYYDGVLTIFGTGSTISSGVKGWGKPETSAWYEYYDDITKVVVGGNITTVGANAFHYMSKLKTVELSKKVTTISGGSFETCGSLDTIYVTGNDEIRGTADLSNITKFEGGYIFDGTSKIKEFILSDDLTGAIQVETFKTGYSGGAMVELTVPAGVTEIASRVFSGNKNFKTLTILGKETKISQYAFANYTDPNKTGFINNIGNVTIVAYADSVAHQFAKYNMMKFIDIETGEEIDYSTVAGDVVSNGELGTNVKYSIVRIEGSDDLELVITGTGSAIVTNATSSADLPYAEYADDIVKVTVKCGTSIEAYAFADMPNLESVELSGSISILGDYVFAGDSKLKNIYISETNVKDGQANLAAISSFGVGCFMGTAISSVNMSKSILEIPEFAFKESALVELALSEKVTLVSAEAFIGCADLSSVTFNAQKYSIEKDAFKGLASDAVISAYEGTAAVSMAESYGYKFNSLGEIPHTIEGEIVSQYVNVAWVFDEFTNVLTVKTTKSGWNESGGVSYENAWGKIVSRIEEVVLIGNMSKISSYAFKGAVNLKKVTIPASITQIDRSAFEGCENLTTVQVAGAPAMDGIVNLANFRGNGKGGSCLSGGSNIFSGASSVKALVLNKFYSDQYPLLSSNIPENLETIYGDTEYLEKYCETNGYEFIPFGYATSINAYWTIDTETQTLTIHGEGAVNGLENTVDAYAADVKHVVIESGITELGANAFSKLTSLQTAKFDGDEPKIAENAKPFGEKDSSFVVYVNSNVEGFDGDTWCGYKLEKNVSKVGDLNNDGEINVVDAVILAQYLAKWSVEVDEKVADTTNDGVVDARDAVLLAQYLAKWNVQIS